MADFFALDINALKGMEPTLEATTPNGLLSLRQLLKLLQPTTQKDTINYSQLGKNRKLESQEQHN